MRTQGNVSEQLDSSVLDKRLTRSKLKEIKRLPQRVSETVDSAIMSIFRAAGIRKRESVS